RYEPSYIRFVPIALAHPRKRDQKGFNIEGNGLAPERSSHLKSSSLTIQNASTPPALYWIQEFFPDLNIYLEFRDYNNCELYGYNYPDQYNFCNNPIVDIPLEAVPHWALDAQQHEGHPWTTPHCSHRDGRRIDISYSIFNAFSETERKSLRKLLERSLRDARLNPVPEGDHFHVGF